MKKLMMSSLVLLIVMVGVMLGSNVYADNGGVWIGDGGVNGSGGGGGGGGGSSIDCTSQEGAWAIECQGYSWVFYKSVVPAAEATAINFVPTGSVTSTITIPKTCAEHTDQGGGFWHLGRNIRALTTDWTDKAYFADFSYVNGIDDKTYTYSTALGSYGHYETLTYDYINSHYGWLGSAGGKKYNTKKEDGVSTMPLNQKLYKNGKQIYQATKISTEYGDAWNAFRAAYKKANGSDYSGTTWPNGLYAFCYWNGATEYTLNVEGKNIYNDADLKSGNGSVKGSGGDVVSYDRVWLNGNGYKFIGFKSSNSTGISGIIKNTSTSSPYVSTPQSGNKYDSSKEQIYTRLHVKLDKTETYYAYYAPMCMLTLDVDEGVDVKVKVTKSPYHWANDAGGAGEWATFDNNEKTIFRGDEFLVYFKEKPGFVLTTHEVGGASFTSGNTYTVCGKNGSCQDGKCENVKIKARSTRPRVTLSGEAVVNDAECTTMSGYNPDSETVEWNTRAVLQHKSIPNLTFEGWRSTKCSGDLYNNEDYVVEHLQTDTKVYAVYSPNILPCANSAAVLGSDCDSSIRIEQSKDNEHWVTNTMYMKPGDTVYVKGYFNPQYQDKKDIRPQKLAITSSSYENNSNGRTIEDYFNLKVNPDWNNAFSILYNAQNNNLSCYKPVNGTSGNNGEYSGTFQYLAILGKEGVAKAATNKCTNTSSTPKKIYFSYDAAYNLQANIDNSSSESNEVKVRTPYNFINTINIETEEGIVYAGETKSISSMINVGSKRNRLTTDGSEEQAYATSVPYAKIKLESNYGTIGGTRDDILTIENLSSGDRNMNIPIKDLPAGTTLKIRACIYPHTSGGDGNWNDKEGDHNWSCSGEKTFIIAKKPSFQVLGGSVYSNGGIAAPAAEKNNLRGMNSLGGKVAVFGSWAENAVVANGAVNGLASGAATGLNITLNEELVNGILDNKDNYCNNRVPLSFANYIPASLGCPDRPITGLLGASNSILDRAALVSYILGNENTINTQLTPNDNNEYILGTKEIFAGTTEVVTAAGDTITIAGNLTYADESYSTLEQVPKLIVYADNINIACDVTRVDAILIANNKIDTCPNSDGTNDEGIARINEAKNNNQLLVNGIIVTNTLDLNRTYGAATGTNSGIPAEIVNYDASTILWSTSQTATDDYANMTAVYQREIAPRY